MPFEFEQHPPRRLWRGGLILGEQRIPLSLRQLDLIEQQFEPIEFAADLGFEMGLPFRWGAPPSAPASRAGRFGAVRHHCL